jgi:phage terminase small subunit
MFATQYARCARPSTCRSKGHFTLCSVGQIREHPALKIEREASATFLRMAVEFGLTPSGRIRLGQAELTRRNLAHELQNHLGVPDLRLLEVVDGSVVK